MSDQPIGYVFQADLYCPSCIVSVASAGYSLRVTASSRGVTLPDVSSLDAEAALDALASAFPGFDRRDERSFDSGDFPKIYAGTPHDGCHVGNLYGPGQCADLCSVCHEPLGYECPNAVDLKELAGAIQALDFDTVFEIKGGEPVRVDDQSAPDVYHDPDNDVTIDGEGWQCLTGLTGQYAYSGAVMHSSEYVGENVAVAIVETACDAASDNGKGCVFALVVVEVLPEDDEDGDPEPQPAGWAIAYKELAG